MAKPRTQKAQVQHRQPGIEAQMQPQPIHWGRRINGVAPGPIIRTGGGVVAT